MIRPALLLAAMVAAVAPAAAQDARSKACRDEADRLTATLARTEGTRDQRKAGNSDGAITPIPSPKAADLERDMARRGGVLTPAPLGSGLDAGATGTPGARADATLRDEDRQQIRRLAQEARTAGERGDTDGCLRTLREARVALQQAGVGGSGGGSGGTTGTTNRRTASPGITTTPDLGTGGALLPPSGVGSVVGPPSDIVRPGLGPPRDGSFGSSRDNGLGTGTGSSTLGTGTTGLGGGATGGMGGSTRGSGSLGGGSVGGGSVGGGSSGGGSGGGGQ